MFSWGFNSRKDKLEEEIEESMKVEYWTDENGEIMLDDDGNPITMGTSSISWGDWSYEYRACTEEEAATVRQLIDIAIPLPSGDSEILSIINEEAEPYYKGQKSLDDVVDTIQRRISMYVGENS